MSFDCVFVSHRLSAAVSVCELHGLHALDPLHSPPHCPKDLHHHKVRMLDVTHGHMSMCVIEEHFTVKFIVHCILQFGMH